MRRFLKSARALDGDEFPTTAGSASGGAYGKDTRDLVAIDLSVRGGFGEFVRAAIRGCRRSPTACSTRKATINTVAVGIVSDNKYAIFRLRRIYTKQYCRGKNQRCEHGPHVVARYCGLWKFVGKRLRLY